jgi:dTDP-4-amino-4,6-dideoxygalactose transaminase
MLLTDDRASWELAWSYKDHGKSYAAVFERQHPPGFRWVHESIGTNWRMTEMQAAIGRRQLTKLDRWLESRQRNARLMNGALAGVPGLQLPVPAPQFGHAYYRYYAFLDADRLEPGWTQERIIDAINREGIPCTAGGCSEIYLEKAFVERGLAPSGRLRNAQRLGETSLAFLVHPTLTEGDIHDTCQAIAKVMAVATHA